MIQHDKNRISEWGFTALVAAGYLLVALVVLPHHELWRDELEPWMIARYSSSLRDLLMNMRYEGHPVLWYIVLYITTRFSQAPEAMQYVNLLISATMVALLARYSPFSRRLKVLFAFGFFPLFQYGIICRGYALCTLMLFVVCAAYPVRKARLPIIALLLAILANADVYGWFYCMAFSVSIAAEWFLDRRHGRRWNASVPEFAGCAALVMAGMLYSVKSCAPPADGGWFTQWYIWLEWDRLLSALYGWAFDFNIGPPIIYVFPSLAMFGWFTYSIRRNRVALIQWTVFAAAIGVFYYTKFLPHLWHKGMVLMFIIGCLWIAAEKKEIPGQIPKPESNDGTSGQSFLRILGWVFAIYVLYSGKWIAQDMLYPYSTTRMAAEFINSQSLGNAFIVGDPDFVTQGVSAYLDKPIYYTASKSVGRYVIWNNKRNWPREDTMDQLRDLRARIPGQMVYIANCDTLPVDRPGFRATLLKQMPRSVLKDERLWIYEIDPALGGAAARGSGR